MKKLLLPVLCFIFLVSVSLFSSQSIGAQSSTEKLDDLGKQIEQYTQELARLQSQASTLANQVAQFNNQIRVTELKINQTQEQITLLGGRIDQIKVSLESLTEAFSSRAAQTYKMARVGGTPLVLVSTPNVSDALSTYHYLQKIQEADRNLLTRLESAHTAYTEQKTQLEDLEKVLGVQKQELDGQKAAKAYLLQVTKNDEVKYNQLLGAARAEYESIQAIIAGKGDEEEVGHVNQGNRIASIIDGPSCNSNGGHLHFIVREDNQVRNPFSYLRGIDHENCSGSSCGSSDGDPFSPSGSWDWPISAPVKFTQGYGGTWAVRNTWVGRIYSFHNGIDIINEGNLEIRAVQPGTLYRGSFSGSAGCRLRYVRVDHDNSNVDTLYLHINY